MQTSFEKITPPEHPAYRAARMIRELHVETIQLMDNGHVFLREGASVNDEMRVSCQEQIVLCDQIMSRSKDMDAKLWEPAALILEAAETTVEEIKDRDLVLASIPEIGNYDHKDA